MSKQKKKNDFTPCLLIEKDPAKFTDDELGEVLILGILNKRSTDDLTAMIRSLPERERQQKAVGWLNSFITQNEAGTLGLASCSDVENRTKSECCFGCSRRGQGFPIPPRLIESKRDNPNDDIKAANAGKVLGHTPDGDALLYIGGKMLRTSVSKMTPAWLRVLTGVRGDEKLKHIAKQWQLEANEKGIFDPEKRIGAGVWRIKDSWVIVSGVSALAIAGNTASIVGAPVYEGHCIEFDAADSWVDLEKVKASFETGDIKASFDECLGIVKQWRWTKPDMAEYATALVCLSPLQRLLRWRPNVAISGPSGCGKSLFAEDLVGRLWGPLVVRSDRATAHSIAQSVGSSGRVLILDEFEKSRRIGEILDLLKLAGRGGFKTSGTGEKSALKFEIRHMVWTLGAHLPVALKTDAAKANRTIRLGMDGGREGSPPVLPSDEAFRGLASQLVGVVLKNWQAIQTAEDAIDSRQKDLFKELPGANSRTVDVFRSASALLTVATGADWTIPTWGAEPLPTDGDNVLAAILSAMMPGQPGTTVEQLLRNPDANKRALEAVGIKMVAHDGKELLAIQPADARQHLLGKTDFAYMDIQEALEHLPGAEKSKAKLNKVSRLAVFVPFELPEEPERQPRQPSGNRSGNQETLISKDLDTIGCRVANETPSENKPKKPQTQTPKLDTSQKEHTFVGNPATKPPKAVSSQSLPVAATVATRLPVADTDKGVDIK